MENNWLSISDLENEQKEFFITRFKDLISEDLDDLEGALYTKIGNMQETFINMGISFDEYSRTFYIVD